MARCLAKKNYFASQLAGFFDRGDATVEKTSTSSVKKSLFFCLIRDQPTNYKTSSTDNDIVLFFSL
jgi:hypothetical protein